MRKNSDTLFKTSNKLIFIYAQTAGLTLLKHIFDKASNNTYKEADKFTDIQADISTDVRTSASPLNLLNHVISETIAENLEEWFQSKSISLIE